MTTILIFDIETVPDIQAGKTLYQLHDLNDNDVANAMFAIRRNKVGHDFLPHHLQKIVAISLVLCHAKQLKVWSLGDLSADEPELIRRFFAGIEKHMPTLISWNGGGFDLPVLHYRALLHGIPAPTYWEQGENLQNFRWNNYLNRYHNRHLDLMDTLAAYQNKAYAPLDEISTMLGFPGKMGMSGDKVWQAYQDGELESIRNYCETDVLNTYCIYLRFELIRGCISQVEYKNALEKLQDHLKSDHNKKHLIEFCASMNCSL